IGMVLLCPGFLKSRGGGRSRPGGGEEKSFRSIACVAPGSEARPIAWVIGWVEPGAGPWVIGCVIGEVACGEGARIAVVPEPGRWRGSFARQRRTICATG